MRVGFWGILGIALAALGQSQNPAATLERQRTPAGHRHKLGLGTLFLPANLKVTDGMPILVHFHGGTWHPEVAAANSGIAVISIHAGEGSGVYAREFADTRRFGALLREAEAKAGVKFGRIALTAWSAGYGSVREILAVPEYYERVDCVLLIDGLHAGYVGDARPGSNLVEAQLAIFLKFARDAVAGAKRMIITHSEIAPGTFASTTETANCLLDQLGLCRRAMIRSGPMGTRQLSEAGAGRFLVLGYAGDSAPDHVAQLESLPVFSGWLLD